MENSSPSLKKSTLSDYVPLLVVAAYIVGGTAILVTLVPGGGLDESIRFFEGLMLSLFALFKLMNVRGFQEGYSTYDLIAQKINAWGRIYPFLELGLGVLLLLNVGVQIVGVIVGILALIGLIGVSIELRKHRKITCACLGTALNVPLTSVTLIENGIMLAAALYMVVNL